MLPIQCWYNTKRPCNTMFTRPFNSVLRSQIRSTLFLLILFVCYFFHPLYYFTIQIFLYGNMCHAIGCRSAMPVFFVWLKPNYVTRMYFLNRAAFSLYPTAACCMIKVCPSGCVCQAVLAPGSNVTLAAAPRLASLALNNGSIRTAPVNQSAGPFAEGCAPVLVISMANCFLFVQNFYFLKKPYQ